MPVLRATSAWFECARRVGMTTIRDVIALLLALYSALFSRVGRREPPRSLQCDEEEQQNAGRDLRAFVILDFLILVLALSDALPLLTGGIIISQNEKRN
jgi:hypothetical protein